MVKSSLQAFTRIQYHCIIRISCREKGLYVGDGKLYKHNHFIVWTNNWFICMLYTVQPGRERWQPNQNPRSRRHRGDCRSQAFGEQVGIVPLPSPPKSLLVHLCISAFCGDEKGFLCICICMLGISVFVCLWLYVYLSKTRRLCGSIGFQSTSKYVQMRLWNVWTWTKTLTKKTFSWRPYCSRNTLTERT